jgi:hypothetical protein
MGKHRGHREKICVLKKTFSSNRSRNGRVHGGSRQRVKLLLGGKLHEKLHDDLFSVSSVVSF